MPSTTHSTRPSRRFRRAGTVAAAAAIALSATVGLGIAPASATAPSTTHSDASHVSTSPAGDPTESKAEPEPVTYNFTTRWVPVARGGQNVLSFRLEAAGSTLQHGVLVPPFNRCIPFPDYRNNIYASPSINYTLLPPGGFTVTSYSSPNCNAGEYKDSVGLLDDPHHSWTIYAHHAPTWHR